MTPDLQQLFTEAGRTQPPSSTVDLDEVVRRGRRARARRRLGTGGALIGAGAVVAASVALVGGVPTTGGSAATVGTAAGGGSAASSSAPGDKPEPASTTVTANAVPQPPKPSDGVPQTKPTPPTALAAAFAAVTLPDPAPGFPVRRWADSVAQETVDGSPDKGVWTKLFGLARTPARETTDANGNVLGTPTGPEITLRVGQVPVASPRGGTVFGNPVTGATDVTVAGVHGTVWTYSEKGTRFAMLTFAKGGFVVEIGGSGGVSDAELVALGNALTGLS